MTDKTLVRQSDAGGGVALITLDDPPANTYTHEMMRQLDDAILEVRFDDDVVATYSQIRTAPVDGSYLGAGHPAEPEAP